LVFMIAYRDKRVVGVFVRFRAARQCAARPVPPSGDDVRCLERIPRIHMAPSS
jgi:hypothetical protein